MIRRENQHAANLFTLCPDEPENLPWHIFVSRPLLGRGRDPDDDPALKAKLHPRLHPGRSFASI